MGGASSVSPAPPTAGPAAAVGVDKQAPERGAADGAGQATETEQARRKSALLRANEAVLFNFIRKNVTLHRPAIPLIEILKVRTHAAEEDVGVAGKPTLLHVLHGNA